LELFAHRMAGIRLTQLAQHHGPQTSEVVLANVVTRSRLQGGKREFVAALTRYPDHRLVESVVLQQFPRRQGAERRHVVVAQDDIPGLPRKSRCQCRGVFVALPGWLEPAAAQFAQQQGGVTRRCTKSWWTIVMQLCPQQLACLRGRVCSRIVMDQRGASQNTKKRVDKRVPSQHYQRLDPSKERAGAGGHHVTDHSAPPLAGVLFTSAIAC